MKNRSVPDLTRGLAHDLDERLMSLHSLIRRDGHQLGLSATSLSVLAQVRDDPRRVTDLAAAEQVAQPSMTALLNRLERRGWVERVADETDGRGVRIRLSSHGADTLRHRTGERVATLSGRLSGLTVADRSTLAAALPALDALIARWAADRPTP